MTKVPKNPLLQRDLYTFPSLELAMLKNAVLTSAFSAARSDIPTIDILGVTHYTYDTRESAEHDFEIIQHEIKVQEKAVDIDVVILGDSCTPSELIIEMKQFVTSIAWWMQADKPYDYKAEANSKIEEARILEERIKRSGI